MQDHRLARWIAPLSLLASLSACEDEQYDPIGESASTGGNASTGGSTNLNGSGGTVSAQGEPLRGVDPLAAIGYAGACDAPDPSVKNADSAELFDYPHVPTFDFYLPDGAWEQLIANAQAEEYIEAHLCFEGRYVDTVGLRFKGYYGSLFGCFEGGQLVCPRLSLKAKFNKYREGQRLFGLKRLNFNAYRHDDSRLRERLVYDLYRSMGVVAPRAAWAVVRVNEESQGLYGMVEQVDGRFTANRWPDNPDGNLYKELWPTQTDSGAIASALSTNEDVADVSGFQGFATAFTSAAAEDQRSELAKHADLDYLARYLAVDDAIVSYDGITYFWTDGSETNNHNFYFYEEGPERFTLIPWDVESSFWINPDHTTPHWTEIPDDCSTTYPYWEGQASAPACDPLIRALVEDLSSWRAAVHELLDGPFAESTMVETINRHAQFIGDEAHADPTPNTYESFDSAVSSMLDTIPALRSRLEQLAGE